MRHFKIFRQIQSSLFLLSGNEMLIAIFDANFELLKGHIKMHKVAKLLDDQLIFLTEFVYISKLCQEMYSQELIFLRFHSYQQVKYKWQTLVGTLNITTTSIYTLQFFNCFGKSNNFQNWTRGFTHQLDLRNSLIKSFAGKVIITRYCFSQLWIKPITGFAS